MRDESSSIAAGLGAIAAIAAAGALVGARDFLGATNIALVLALVVVGAAMMGGRGAGAATSVAAALAFDFFHTRPYYDLRIDKREDVIAAVLLLIIGVVVGELASRQHLSRRGATKQQHGVLELERLSALVAAGADLDAVWPIVREGLAEQLDLAECRYEPDVDGRPFPVLDPIGRLEGHQFTWVGNGFALPADGVQVPMSDGVRSVGRLVLVPRPGTSTSRAQRRLAVAIGDIFAVAVGHSTTVHPLS